MNIKFAFLHAIEIESKTLFNKIHGEREREEKKALNKDRSDTHSHSIYACTEHIKHCPQDQISNNLMYV